MKSSKTQLMQDYETIVHNTKRYFENANINKAVIGVSGGIDSALTLKVAVDSIGKQNVIGLLLPERGLTSEENINDAKNWCEKLDIEYKIIFINDYLKTYLGHYEPTKEGKIALMNVKSRIRATLLYFFANKINGLVVGTTNRTEMHLGYYTKYGDGAVDIEPIAELFKTEVWQIGRELELPKKIINKKPTAELVDAQTDEEELGMNYKDADNELRKYEKTGTCSEHILTIIKKTEHKRKMPPVMKRDEKQK